MKELIKLTEQRDGRAVSARELYSFLKPNTPFTIWIKRMFEYDFIQNIDYQAINIFVYPKNGIGGTKRKDYVLTIGCAKEISMLQRTPRGKEARLYFIRMEEQARTQQIKVKTLDLYGHKVLSYPEWLLQNGYSIMSGSVRGRIRKHPGHFYKNSLGKWFISEEYAEALLSYRDGIRELKALRALPYWQQVELFEENGHGRNII